MKYSGLYYVNNPSASLDDALKIVNTLVQGIETSFPAATRQSPWSLSYRAFRDTIAPNFAAADAEGKPKPYLHSYQHILHHSSLATNRAYIYVQPAEGSGVVTAIPSQQQDAHASLLRHQHAALWTQRHVLAVQQGTTYAGGLFTVQIGELRASREGPQSGGVQSPGIVVCISTAIGSSDDDDEHNLDYAPSKNDPAPDDGPVDIEGTQSIIRDFWARIIDGRDLGRSEAREVMMTPESVKGMDEKDAMVRMWCEVLRLRGDAGLPVALYQNVPPIDDLANAAMDNTTDLAALTDALMDSINRWTDTTTGLPASAYSILDQILYNTTRASAVRSSAAPSAAPNRVDDSPGQAERSSHPPRPTQP
ncbi:hypothetical protein P153DRAFT_399611 [Dothidotthia symphoricarpi CBS 119687]|uniref:Mediator of RNA polymerase II transcription subunit 20 n=1 Tax=Dothidotthia symphoricarpi CBS 119687 TaxID=1392245 RepID=A0A6A6A4R0_9PLEO|nr:uncharacterized protein P153DRAFT_399611 [Dothidotthia symphoricarpi CBS 119687]KAF2126153.1 hypothetical protein P153DRAFT_399611 [Dothidotthia symphoricarpi CBS 119687]